MTLKTAFLAAAALGALAATPALAQPTGHEGHQPAPAPEPADHSQHQQPDPAVADPHPQAAVADPHHQATVGTGHGEHSMPMTGALGRYPMARESSGTAWQPDSSSHGGLHLMSGEWTLMGHGVLNLTYDHQSAPKNASSSWAPVLRAQVPRLRFAPHFMKAASVPAIYHGACCRSTRKD
jgi:hypothetical protein